MSIIDASYSAEIVRWVAKSKRPFQIVNDRAFQSLMKTGRPGYHIPSPNTVSRDVKQVFLRLRSRVAQILQVFFSPLITINPILISTWHLLQDYEGAINFAMDAWTSPNHKAFVAFTVHMEHRGEPFSMLLDLLEVAKSHSGKNLADAFEKTLKDFGLSDKVSFFNITSIITI